MSLRIFFFLFLLAISSDAFAQIKKRFGRYSNNYGYKQVSGPVRNHQPHGVWITRVPDGPVNKKGEHTLRISEITHYDHGKMHGTHILFDVNGDTIFVELHVQNVRVHERRYNGKVLHEVHNYDSAGRVSGWQYSYYENGVLRQKLFYYNPKCCWDWQYYRNGHIQARREMCSWISEGTAYLYKDYDTLRSPQDSLPIEISEHHNGQPHGPTRTYLQGVIQSETWFRDAKADSVSRYYTNGILTGEKYMRNGMRNGQSSEWTPSGKLRWQRGFAADKDHGECVVYDTLTGNILSHYWYTHGRLDSLFDYSPEGKLVLSQRLVNANSMQYEWKQFYPTGAWKVSGMLLGNALTGERTEWHANGKKKLQEYFVNGDRNGALLCWNEKGVLVFRTVTCMGRSMQTEEVWDDDGRKLSRGTETYTMQLQKYMPSGLALFVPNEFYPAPVVATADLLRHLTSRLNLFIDLGTGNDSCGAATGVTPPQFPGGEDARLLWYRKNLRYPMIEWEMNISGSTWLSFTIQADSSITDVVLLKGIVSGPGLDKEALRVTRAMPKWIPARKNGKAVVSTCVMEVRWVLR